MPETTSNARVWNGFVCPDCRHVFRVARDHDGRGIVCPECRRMLKLPEEGDEIPPLVVAPSAPDERAETASDEPSSPGVERDGDSRRRRKHRKQGVEFDETFADKSEMSPGLVRGLIGSLVMMALIIAGALWWAFAGGDDRSQVRPVTVAGEPEPEPEYTSEADRAAAERTLVAMVIEDELLPVVRRFLEAGTVGEMAELVLHPDVSLPRMEEFHADGLVAPGLSTVVWQADNHRRGEWATIVVETGEFVSRPIWLKEVGEGWKIDWESWAGWSPIGFEEMKRERPTEAVKLRVLASDISYYNFGFADESEWTSYLLESPDRTEALYGYVPKGGELELKLDSVANASRLPFVLRLRYPEEDARDNQVIIEEVVSDSWLDTEEE